MTHTTYFLRFNKQRIVEKHLFSNCSWLSKRGFAPPLTAHGSKVYLFSNKGEIIYVGKCSQKSISSRFNAAFGADQNNRRNGYRGYDFKNHLTEAVLHVFTSADWIKSDPVLLTPIVEDVELIEAEICYLIRESTGSWPRHQNEIHFGRFQPKHLKYAEEILQSVKKVESALPEFPIPNFTNP